MERQTIFQKLMGFINKIGSAIMLNLLFLVSCIPVVTMGAAASGLYSAVRFSIRGDSAFAGYKEGFKKNFLRVAIATVICLAVGIFSLLKGAMYVDTLITHPDLISVGSVIQAAVHVVMFCAVLLLSTAMIPVSIYFENDANGWLMDSWYLVGHGFFQVLLSAVILWAPVVLILFFPMWGLLGLLIFIAVYYAVMAVVITALLKNTLLTILYRHKAAEEEA